ncbi:Small nuclear ribonucleoprotein family protein [Hibiscus syriacus]|uniref:Small nuclear ribonucleoprotein family protein n=1 Tax=Hibiscus syriacus TaxID=106335 RepID=A0A6A3AHZ2_HIBSY|nr:Small nuclear ribonucleoprotein family protein [Hibiscus syriacus]
MEGVGIDPCHQQRPSVHAPPPSAASSSPISHHSHQDKVRTIFISGLPEDVKERELQILLRWLPGYEVSQVSYKGEKPKAFVLFSNVKFAVAAKVSLQEMVFDIKLKSFLHIEMAKKNLVVKRGIGREYYPVPPVLPVSNSAPVAFPSFHVPDNSGGCVEKSAANIDIGLSSSLGGRQKAGKNSLVRASPALPIVDIEDGTKESDMKGLSFEKFPEVSRRRRNGFQNLSMDGHPRIGNGVINGCFTFFIDNSLKIQM